MKTIKILTIFSALFVLFLTSCEDEENLFETASITTIAFNGNADTLLSVSEDQGSFDLEVYTTLLSNNDITVTLSFTDITATNPDHYIPSSSSVIIPAGEYFGSVSIDLIDDLVGNDSREFSVEISSVSTSDSQIGLADLGTKYKRVVIVNDDCPTQYNLWFGNITFDDVGYSTGLPAVGSANAAGNCDILLVAGDLPNFNGTWLNPYVLNFTPFSPGSSTGTVDVPEIKFCNACSGGMDLYYSGNGLYDESTGEITINYQVVRDDGAGYTGTNIIYTP